LELSTTLHYKKYLEKFSSISRGYRTSVTNAGTLGRLKSPLVGLRCLQHLLSGDLPMLRLIIIFTLYLTTETTKDPIRAQICQILKFKKKNPTFNNKCSAKNIEGSIFIFSHPYIPYSQIWLNHLLRNATLATLKIC